MSGICGTFYQNMSLQAAPYCEEVSKDKGYIIGQLRVLSLHQFQLCFRPRTLNGLVNVLVSNDIWSLWDSFSTAYMTSFYTPLFNAIDQTIERFWAVWCCDASNLLGLVYPWDNDWVFEILEPQKMTFTTPSLPNLRVR